jgi:hypothetical protein
MMYFPLRYRIIAGLTFFGILGILDFIKNPNNPKRLKEYGFLFSVTGITMMYGLIHDYITSTISPDYFVLGKGIESAAQGFNKDVAILALEATWSAGLIIGVAFLIANNSSKTKPQLKYKTLYGLLIYPLSLSVLFAVLTGIFFNLFTLRFSASLNELLSPQSRKLFMTVWGIHIGSYAGGLSGIIVGIIRTRKLRTKQALREIL